MDWSAVANFSICNNVVDWSAVANFCICNNVVDWSVVANFYTNFIENSPYVNNAELKEGRPVSLSLINNIKDSPNCCPG